jgi:hypothetical protein
MIKFTKNLPSGHFGDCLQCLGPVSLQGSFRRPVGHRQRRTVCVARGWRTAGQILRQRISPLQRSQNRPILCAGGHDGRATEVQTYCHLADPQLALKIKN